MVEGWKSGACLSTILSTLCAKPPSRRPMILIGKAVGNASAASGSGGLAFLPCTHDLLLEFLVQAMHLAKHRPGLARADRLAIQSHDREHLLGGGRHPELVGAAHLGLAEVAELERQLRRGGELDA